MANMFYDGELQSGIGLAVQQAKAVLCFVTDDSHESKKWEDMLRDASLSQRIASEAVALRIIAGSQEAGFLSGICPIDAIPAIIVIKNAALILNLKISEVPVDVAKLRLESTFTDPSKNEALSEEPEPKAVVSTPGYIDLPDSAGRKRLPNNAYDAFRRHTQTLVDQGASPEQILQAQIKLLRKFPSLRVEVENFKHANSAEDIQLSVVSQDRLLQLPGAMIGKSLSISDAPTSSSTSSNQPPTSSPITTQSPQTTNTSSPMITSDSPVFASPNRTNTTESQPDKLKDQRADYLRMQREREQQERKERERIKAQIKADRDAIRKQDDSRRQPDSTEADKSSTLGGSSSSQQANNEVRVQVRVFDGSTLRNTFPTTSSISKDIRRWVDATSDNTVPYNLKLILTPLPNRNIEPGEEEQTLYELGIRNSCTLVMVPVKGYVDSYVGEGSGAVGSAITGGYGLAKNTATSLFGGVKSFLNYVGGVEPQPHQRQLGRQVGSTTRTSEDLSGGSSATGHARVRTLADQRAEDAKKDQQFYNGNQLNFEPRKDDTDDRKRD